MTFIDSEHEDYLSYYDDGYESYSDLFYDNLDYEETIDIDDYPFLDDYD